MYISHLSYMITELLFIAKTSDCSVIVFSCSNACCAMTVIMLTLTVALIEHTFY